MHKKVIILGSGQTLSLYKYQQGDVVWCPLAMTNDEIKDKIALTFGMHNDEIGVGDVDQNNYPIREIVKEFGSSFFTNTISYMIAYAIYTGVEDITIYGVDMNINEEYYQQRPSVLYWIGYARGKGIKVNVMNNIDKESFLYGYQDLSTLKFKIEQLKNWSDNERAKSENKDERNQYLGFNYALSILEKEL